MREDLCRAPAISILWVGFERSSFISVANCRDAAALGIVGLDQRNEFAGFGRLDQLASAAAKTLHLNELRCWGQAFLLGGLTDDSLLRLGGVRVCGIVWNGAARLKVRDVARPTELSPVILFRRDNRLAARGGDRTSRGSVRSCQTLRVWETLPIISVAVRLPRDSKRPDLAVLPLR